VIAQSLPVGEAVAEFETYPEAQAALERLAKAEFPIREVSIVGSGLKSVERVTGRLSYGRAAAAGAAGGAWFGLFFGLLLFLFTTTAQTFALVGAAVLIGAGFGMLFNIVVYTFSRRRRDYSSVSQVLASSYALIVAGPDADKAKAILDRPSAN
jgi:hypothetical protein